MDGGTKREMELLDSYLRAVKRYLPRGQADDIIKELGDDLRSQIDEKGTELGRPLSDAEEMAIFKENGDPMLVARRYRQDRRSLSLGWELIGPELFPMYLIILCVNLTITVVAITAFALFTHTLHHDSGFLLRRGGPDRVCDAYVHHPEFYPPQVPTALVLPSGGIGAADTDFAVVFDVGTDLVERYCSVVAGDSAFPTRAAGRRRCSSEFLARVAHGLRSGFAAAAGFDLAASD